MINARWERISAVFEAAMEREPADRLPFVRDACADDPEVRREVESMLEQTDRPQLLDRPAAQAAADLLPGASSLACLQLGQYRIESLLGAGGMGEVYRATDTVLGRQVAIKMLPATLAADPDRLSRFRREARLLATVNHPNIGAIYGAEPLPGQQATGHALILELIEGPTLAERIKAGRLSVDEAVADARQIAGALEAAHRQGIVHRDLKPSNIKITPDGTVKVLDFGLAKLTQRDGDDSAGDPSTSPTITSPHLVTGAGMLLGTAAYMSPEQAKAREADYRSDIWAFGCVLYEMLSGRRAFDGEDATDILGAVVRLEPDWSALPPDVPVPLVALMKGCLIKERRHRVGDISAARFVLDNVAALAPAPGAPSPARRHVVLSYLAAAAAATVLAGTAIGAAVWWWMRVAPPGVTRFAFAPTGAETVNVDVASIDLAILPDGRRLVYGSRGTAGTGPRLLVRALDRLEPTTLFTGGIPRAPFASADGTAVGFVSLGRGAPELKSVALNGGPVTTICSLDGQSRGVTWGESGQIIFATSNAATGLQRVAAAGGTPETLTAPDTTRGEGDHLWPQYVPGRELVLFTITSATGGIETSQIAVLDLRTRNRTVLSGLAGGSQAHYVRSGHLVYFSRGSLYAVPFDVDRLEVTGQPRTVVPGIETLSTGTAEFDVSRDGTLVYIPASASRTRTLVWVDRTGREDAVQGAPARAYMYPRVSPDGRQIAVDSRDEENDIWIFDVLRQTLRQLTFGPVVQRSPTWMPGGSRVLFTSQPVSGIGLGGPFARAADGTGTVEPLFDLDTTNESLLATSITPDGTHLVGWSISGSGSTFDLMLVNLKTRRAEPLLPMSSIERNAEISPDGRWLAFESDRDRGQFGIYVVPFPAVNGGLWRVSDGTGGVQPAWARNGRELFYVGLDGTMRSVRVDGGAGWSAGAPQSLYPADYFPGAGVIGRAYDVAPDGRFLMVKEGTTRENAPPTIVVTQNWIEELKKLPTD